jgi:NADH:ubiquinone oxidoreductase subunit F (NADH-binding)
VAILAAPMALLDIAPATLDDYIAGGGLLALERALGSSPDAVIDEVTKSGLRGRGGGAFPTGAKWQTVRTTGSGTRYAVCNAAEGEPATYKDRLLMLRNPYQVLEGLVIGAWAVGAKAAIIGLKETFVEEAARVGKAIEEMHEVQGLAGVSLEMALGPDLYLLGEETGLLEVIENRPPLPRSARPFMLGLFGSASVENPTLVNNAETLANVPPIVANGADWLRATGTDTSPGTMLFTVCGDVRREGVFELPMGTSLRQLIEELAGGVPEGRTLKAIVPGASNTVILPQQLDTPMDFDSMKAAGTGLGSAGFCVFDDSACIVKVAHMYSRFLWVESCGQCPPCKLDSGEVTAHLERLEAGEADMGDLDIMLVRAQSVTDGQKCALPTGESLLMQSLFQTFGEEFAAHVGRTCPLPRKLVFPKIVGFDEQAGRFSYDQRYGLKQADWTYAGE